MKIPRVGWRGALVSAAVIAAAAGATFGALTLLGGGGGVQAPSSNVHGPGPSEAAQIVNPRTAFPDVVATVYGQPISGTDLAYQVEVLRVAYGDTGDTATTSADVVQEAIRQLINFEILVQEGERRGLTPTDEEARAYLEQNAADLLQIPSELPQRQAIEVLAKEFGYDLSDPASSPVLMTWARRTLTAIRMRNAITAGLPPEQQGDWRAEQQAVDLFIEQQKSQVAVRVLLPGYSY